VVDTVVGETVVGDTVVGEVVGDTVGEVGDTVVGEVVGLHVWPGVVGVRVVGERVVGLVVGQSEPSAVPPMPSIEPSQVPVYDVPRVPTLTRAPHSPALLYTCL
jgi:hypothetical protein